MAGREGEIGVAAEAGEEEVREQVALEELFREGGGVAETQAVAEAVEGQEERLEQQRSQQEGEETAETDGELALQD